MADVVVTVPMGRWDEWIGEGNLPGQSWDGEEYEYRLGQPCPDVRPGERVYVVAHGKLRGYAPLLRAEFRPGDGDYLIRGGDAVAVTIPEPIRGFRGWRPRWWPRESEVPFPEWRQP